MAIIYALLALVLAPILIYFLARRVDIGLACLLGVELVFFTFGLSPIVVLKFHLDPQDLVLMSLVGAGIIRFSFALKRINLVRVYAVVYAVLFAFSMARGIYTYGVQSAMAEAREYVAPLVGMLYFLTAPTDEKSVRRYTQIYLIFGGLLCCVALMAALGAPVGISETEHQSAAGVNGRYLAASAAAAIGICGFISLSWLRYRGAGLLLRLLPMTYMAIAIYLRHRTVWLMVLIGTFALLPLDRRLFKKLMPAAVVAVIAIGGFAYYGAGGITTDQFADSATNGQTWQWRVNTWEALLLDDEQNALTVSVGKGMGSGYWRFDPGSNQVQVVHPHNEYVNEYLRVGVIGTIALLLFTFKPLFSLWRYTKIDAMAAFPSTSAWAVVVLVILVFGVTYDVQGHAYAMIGIANAIAMSVSENEEEYAYQDVDEWNMVHAQAVTE